MKIGLVGWGVETQSVYRYFGPEHEYLIVNEEPKDSLPAASKKVRLQFLADKRPSGTTGNAQDLSYLEGLDDCDKIFYSPTSYKNLEKYYPAENKIWRKVTSDKDVFFEKVKSKNIIGVTGTKGKGTTTTLIWQILNAAGHKTFLGGNIGTPVLDFVDQVGTNDWVVLELSSFQLYSLKHSPRVAVCLMISKEHLDWHESMEEYINSKANIFRFQKDNDVAIYFADDQNSKQIASHSKGIKIPYFEKPGAYVRDDGWIVAGQDEAKVLKTDQLKLMGKHNWQNICAAVTVACEATQDLEAMRKVLSTFSGLEHRLEFVRELDGVKYYDDSFGTNPETAIVALEAIVQPAVIIVGGYDRGIPMDPLIDELMKDRVKHVVAIGQTGKKIAAELAKKGFNKVTLGPKDMPGIVAAAKKLAEPGDAVLLSTAATSFDMFPNFEVRGDEFKKAVMAL